MGPRKGGAWPISCFRRSDISRRCVRTTVKRSGRERGTVIRNFLGGLVLAFTCLSALAAGGASDKPHISTMRFVWRGEKPADLCGKMCRTWISAVGPVTDQTPHDFQVFAEQKDVHGATLLLDAEGGSVVDSIELGRALRGFNITTTVGKTVIASAADGSTTTALSPSAACESMCAFVLL